MLSAEQVKSQSQYKYRAGMVNVVYVAGLLRHPRKNEGYIQQTNNLNQMIHFRCEPGVSIPRDYIEGQPIKIIARMHSHYVNGRSTIALEVKRFEQPSIQDMPPRKAWEHSLRQGVPTDSVTPQAFREERLDGWRVEDAGNMAELAGFVAAYTWDAPKEGGNGCLTILIRQVKDEKDLLPVRCYTKESKSLYQKLAVGMPLFFKGRISVDIKNTGEPAGEGGVLPTHKYQYLRVNTLQVAGALQIAVKPEWVQGMMISAVSERKARAQANAAAKPEKSGAAATPPTEGQVQAAQKPVSEMAQTGAVAAQNASPTSLTGDIPASVLAALQKQ